MCKGVKKIMAESVASRYYVKTKDISLISGWKLSHWNEMGGACSTNGGEEECI
jgi:hypothetical protein